MDQIKKLIEESIEVKNKILSNEDILKKIDELTDTAVAALKNNHRIYFCGNGGSAADAQHIAAEFVGRFVPDRRALPAISLATDTSALTALGNDYGYNFVFSRQVEAYRAAGGAILGISTSGNSTNIIEAFRAARDLKMTTIGLTADVSDFLIDVPSRSTPPIQQVHICLYHYICGKVEERPAARAKRSAI